VTLADKNIELLPYALGVDDAALYGGFSRALLYKKVKDKSLPIVKIGGRTLIRRADLEAFIDAGKISAT